MAWVEKIGDRSWRVRYTTAGGRVGSVSGFGTRRAAETYEHLVEARQRTGTWVDPAYGRTTLADWAKIWTGTLDMDPRTEENYQSRLRCHILPRWGTTPLADIGTAAINTWLADLDHAGYARTTITSIVKVLSMILTDAVDEHLITYNPVRRRRHRGRHRHHRQPERVWATPEEVLQVADQARVLYGNHAATLIITAAWTGARWGELAGLHRTHLHLHDRRLVVDPDTGALHESARTLWLGPPKTASSARTITLPRFLADLLAQHLASHDHPQVFPSPEGGYLRRSNFDRRALRPAADGNHHIGAPWVRTHPVTPGLTFHGLRHSHKTWMIADGIPEIAQARRLGHHLDNRIVECYSHVAPEVERRLQRALHRRWVKANAAIHGTPTINDQPTRHLRPA